MVRITFKAIKVSRRMPKEAGDNGGLNSYRSPRDFGGKHSEALFTALVAGIATFLMPLGFFGAFGATRGPRCKPGCGASSGFRPLAP